MSSTVLLPPEIAANTNRWFGRARNYPIFSLPWFRYRSVSMLIGSALFVMVGVALMGLTRAPGRERTIDLFKALEGSLAYLVTAAVAILLGPALAVGVRSLRLRPWIETCALVAVLGLGLFISFGIVQKEAMSWYGRGSYDRQHDVVVYDRLVYVFDFDVRRRPATAHIGLRDPALTEQYLRAYDNYARQFGLPDRLRDGWPQFMTDADRRLVAQMRNPGLAQSELRALEDRYAVLLEKVYRETSDLHWRGYRKHPRKTMTPEQKRAKSMLLASMRAEAPAPVAADKHVAVQVFRASGMIILLAHLSLFAWLGGVFELLAFVRQRGMLGDAHAKQELERARAERNAAETRLSVLAAQVEPHFLFNTLASVRAALATDPQRAGHIIDHMTDYLRSTIPQMRGQAARPTVALESQLAAARAYLALMHERMRRLQFSVEAEPNLEQASIPPLMLISLVENAVKHGVEPKIGAARVEVRARRDGEVLDVTVSDDGVGFGASVSGSGIGLANIQERLRALYGEGAGLTLKTRPEGGVAATLRLPLSFES